MMTACQKRNCGEKEGKVRELEGRRIAVFGRGSQFEPADFEVASRTFLLLTTEITSSKQIYHLAVIVPSYQLPYVYAPSKTLYYANCSESVSVF